MVKILKIYYGFAINVKEHIVMLFSMKNNYEFLKERYKMYEIYPGIYRLENGDYTKLRRSATKTANLFYKKIKSIMTKEDAEKVKKLRIADGNTWRGVAVEMFNEWGEKACWKEIPSNQLAGMALCEVACELLGENWYEEPFYG